MANNYTLSSSVLSLDPDQLQPAREIIASFKLAFDEDDDLGFIICEDSDGIGFHHDESCDVENVAKLVQALLDGLEIDEEFIFSWANTCDKPRIDEFSGGGCCVRRGKPPKFVGSSDSLLPGRVSVDAVLELCGGRPTVTAFNYSDEALYFAVTCAIANLGAADEGEGHEATLRQYGHITEGDYEVHLL